MKILDVPQSGSIAGQTSSRNRFGQYRRTRAVPVNPNSDRQSVVRSVFSGCASSWSSLTDEQRAAWSAWSALHPRTDSLGQTIVLSGFQMFQSVNCMLVGLGLTSVAAPPVDPILDPPSTTGLSSDITGGALTMEIGYTPSPSGANTRLVAEASPPLSPGVSFNNDWRQISATAANAAAPFDIGAAYQAKFGLPALGLKVFVRTYLVRSDGQASPRSEVSTSIFAEP